MSEFDWQDARKSLQHVYWIGGSACGGKTTISKRLAESHGFARYDGEFQAGRHEAMATEAECPTLHRIASTGGFAAHLRNLLPQKPEQMAESFLDHYRDDLLLTTKDLLSMPSDRAIVVDLAFGYPIPELRQLVDFDHAVFLVADDQFRRREFERRFHPESFIIKTLDGYANPKDIVMSGFVEAIRLLSVFTHRECESNGLLHLETGGSMTEDQVYEAVCSHFGI